MMLHTIADHLIGQLSLEPSTKLLDSFPSGILYHMGLETNQGGKLC